MRRFLPLVVLLGLFACKDPFDFEPNDPTKPDPPAPPALLSPVDGWESDSYEYPQSITFRWQPLAGATFYEVKVYRDTFANPAALVRQSGRVGGTSVTLSISTYGFYCWHVRAASRNWNDYTAWSGVFQFSLPNPAR